MAADSVDDLENAPPHGGGARSKRARCEDEKQHRWEDPEGYYQPEKRLRAVEAAPRFEKRAREPEGPMSPRSDGGGAKRLRISRAGTAETAPATPRSPPPLAAAAVCERAASIAAGCDDDEGDADADYESINAVLHGLFLERTERRASLSAPPEP